MEANLLSLVGLAKKAGRLEIGEEPVGAVARARQAKLIIVAADAADNTRRRARHFAEAGNVPWLGVPFSKSELGFCVGRRSCAMMAFTDMGLASALVNKLAVQNPERYAESAQQFSVKADKVLQRQKEQRAHEKNLREGKHRSPWAPPTAPASKGQGGKSAPGQAPSGYKGKPTSDYGYKGKPAPGRSYKGKSTPPVEGTAPRTDLKKSFAPKRSITIKGTLPTHPKKAP